MNLLGDLVPDTTAELRARSPTARPDGLRQERIPSSVLDGLSTLRSQRVQRSRVDAITVRVPLQVLRPPPSTSAQHLHDGDEARAGELDAASLAADIITLFGDGEQLAQMGHNARKLAMPDAAKAIADYALALGDNNSQQPTLSISGGRS